MSGLDVKGVMIYGAQGTRKTLSAPALAKHFKCTRIVDGGLHSIAKAKHWVSLGERVLYLTHETSDIDVVGRHFECYTIEEARKLAGIEGRA